MTGARSYDDKTIMMTADEASLGGDCNDCHPLISFEVLNLHIDIVQYLLFYGRYISVCVVLLYRDHCYYVSDGVSS